MKHKITLNLTEKASRKITDYNEGSLFLVNFEYNGVVYSVGKFSSGVFSASLTSNGIVENRGNRFILSNTARIISVLVDTGIKEEKIKKTWGEYEVGDAFKSEDGYLYIAELNSINVHLAYWADGDSPCPESNILNVKHFSVDKDYEYAGKVDVNEPGWKRSPVTD